MRDYQTLLNPEDGEHSADEIIAMSTKVEAMSPCHSETFTPAVVERLDPRLKIVANHSVGVDHCALDAFRDTRDAMGLRALDNLDAFFVGRHPGDRVA